MCAPGGAYMCVYVYKHTYTQRVSHTFSAFDDEKKKSNNKQCFVFCFSDCQYGSAFPGFGISLNPWLDAAYFSHTWQSYGSLVKGDYYYCNSLFIKKKQKTFFFAQLNVRACVLSIFGSSRATPLSLSVLRMIHSTVVVARLDRGEIFSYKSPALLYLPLARIHTII